MSHNELKVYIRFDDDSDEYDDGKYGSVTMIVPASGHQVCCVPWVQMGTFNK